MKNFKNLVYGKINLHFDKEVFIKEYDEYIFPKAHNICNSLQSIETSKELNKKWGMVDLDLYDTCDVFVQPRDFSTYKYIKRQREQWRLFTLTELDENSGADSKLIEASKLGGNGIRNISLGLRTNIKKDFVDLEIVKWIENTLPFDTIQYIHCVSIEPNGFASIHRDMRGFYNNRSTSGKNLLYKEGYVVIVLNISNGGSPLYWALDGKEIENCFTADEDVYISNDYFVHGVGVCSSRRRQIRVSGIPNSKLWDLIDKDTVMEIDDDYQYIPFFANEK